MTRMIDMTGMKFSKWTVLRLHGKNTSGGYSWVCRCECGNERIVSCGNLRSGGSRHCRWCASTKHGGSAKREYRVWIDMISRCRKENHKSYKYYGGRGISVCERWLNSFEAFFEDMGPRPTKKHTLDRFPDNDGNYEPGNCRWATMAQQSENKSSTRLVCAGGLSLTIRQWAARLGVSHRTLEKRLYIFRWPDEKVILTPIRKLNKRERQ